jgi:uncharacterized membrane protein
MKPSVFLGQLDHARISSAIASAERSTSGEIRVFISHRKISEALSAAEEQFLKLGMARTKDRNAVLLFFAPASQTFAVVGDEGIHNKCGQALWERLVSEVRAHLTQNQFTDGIVRGIETVGELLTRHFPPDASSGDELSNDVIED